MNNEIEEMVRDANSIVRIPIQAEGTTFLRGLHSLEGFEMVSLTRARFLDYQKKFPKGWIDQYNGHDKKTAIDYKTLWLLTNSL